MRILATRLVVAALAAAPSASACAQGTAPPCTFGNYPFVYAGWGVPAKLSTAFSAEVYWTFEQKLADGTMIRAWSRTRVARDSEGRTRFERPQGCARGEDGQLHIRMDVSVFDPVTGKNMFWIEGPQSFNNGNVVHVSSPQVASQTAKATVASTPEERNAAAERQRLAATEREMGPVTSRRIDLGSATIGGVTATAYEFQNVSLSEPDPSLFGPPAGFKVQETKQGN
jgi:hypothetical protein